MLARLDVGADARLFHLVIDDNLVGIAIQRHAMSKLIFGRNDNLFATRELDRALGCTTVRVELAYGMLPAKTTNKGLTDWLSRQSHWKHGRIARWSCRG